MATTPNYGFELTAASETSKLFSAYRNSMSDNVSTSNLMKIDSAIYNIRDTNYTQGVEYLEHYHTILRNNGTAKIVWSGDSTTEGGVIVDHDYYLDNLSQKFLDKCGKTNITNVNKGHAGKLTSDWVDTYLSEDLALNPDLYILRWGLNDGVNPIETRLATFEEELENGLIAMRSSKSISNMSVILMTPNTADGTYNRTPEWSASTVSIIRELARKYSCCFVNTYEYLQDPNSGWLDSAKLHPYDTGNAWIVNLISELLCPTTLRSGKPVMNIKSTISTRVATDAPSTYQLGISIEFAYTGFPCTGFVMNAKSEDGICLQFNVGVSGDDNRICIRKGYSLTDIWGEWHVLS